jgi:hypothetical protein
MKLINICVILSIFLYASYFIKVKTNSNIDIFPGHTPKSIEHITGGIVQCKWFPNPQHCK